MFKKKFNYFKNQFKHYISTTYSQHPLISTSNVFMMKCIVFSQCDSSFHDLSLRHPYFSIYYTSSFQNHHTTITASHWLSMWHVSHQIQGRVFHQISKLRSGFFPTNFEMVGYLVKHSSLCLIQVLKALINHSKEKFTEFYDN